MATRLASAAGVVLAVWLAHPARAHLVYGTPSLHDLVRDADLVVRVRVAGSRRLVLAPRLARPVVDAAVLETLHGEHVPRVTFAPHGHGAAEYHDGEEALVFLRRLERVPELAATSLVGRVRWVSLQETTDRIPLGPRTRKLWVEAVQRYLGAEALVDPAERQAALRETTIALLASREPRLAASALRDLVRVGDASPLTTADASRLDALVRTDTVPVTVRVGILAELERRGLVDGPPRWAQLLASAHGPDLLVVVRAAGAHPSPDVTTELLRVLAGPVPETAAAAAVSLGVPGNHAAVAALAESLTAADAGLRFAAIRALGQIGGEQALEALRHAAAFHSDAATRRRAGAEVTLLVRPPGRAAEGR